VRVCLVARVESNAAPHNLMPADLSHPLLSYPEEARVSYLSLLAEICYVDSVFDDQERKQLEEKLEILNISDSGRARVYAAVYDLKQERRQAIISDIKTLASSDLRFTLITDLFGIALANDLISEEEEEYVLSLGKELGISKEQVMAIQQVELNLWKLKDLPSESDTFKKLIKECAGSLSAVGVPVAAIAASGSVFGLGGAGLTSGLAALGALVGGGMLAGAVVVVPALAVGSAWGVKKLIELVVEKEQVIKL
jgi:uncharacterized tellurite resistance protein B-like protein